MFRPFALLAITAAVLAAQSGSAVRVLKVVGERHKLVLFSDGTVAGWGNCSSGELGPVTFPVKSYRSAGLVTIALPGRAIDIAAGAASSYALLENGTVVAWGKNFSGELGSGAAVNSKLPGGVAGSEVPVTVDGVSGAKQIVAYDLTAHALLSSGAVVGWGGPLGKSPSPVANATNLVQISSGGGHVLGLTAAGRVLSWGSNYYGALGRPPRQEQPINTAAEVPGLSDVLQVAAGTGISTVLKKDGTIWVWGANWHGQFGNGDRTDPPGVNYGYELAPRQVTGVTNVVSISLGLTGRHTLALLKDGTLRGWGNTDWGQLGAGVSGTFQLRPVSPKIANVKSVFAAGNNSFAVLADGSLWIWGLGERGEWPLAANAKTPVRLDLR